MISKYSALILAVVLMIGSPLGSAAQDGSSRNTPIPPGQQAVLGTFTVSVIGVNYDATDLILPEYQFNQPPPTGNVFVMVRLAVTYGGTEITQLGRELRVQVVGNANVGYTQLDPNSCGVIPEDAYAVGDLFSNAAVEYNVCWQVTAIEAPSLVLYVETRGGSNPFFFALTGAPPIATSPTASPAASPQATLAD